MRCTKKSFDFIEQLFSAINWTLNTKKKFEQEINFYLKKKERIILKAAASVYADKV